MKQNYYFRRMLSALVLLLASTLSWAYEFSAENADGVTIYYKLIKNKTEAEVTYYSSSKYSGEIVIPSTVAYYGNTLSVTSIGGSAFSGCRSLTSVTIPNSVTSIGESAFYDCSSLTSVTIPEGVTSISSYAFYGCSGLTGTLTIGDCVTSIGEYAFYNCSSLTSVTIPESVTEIDSYAFEGCSGLRELILSDGTKTLSMPTSYYSSAPFKDSPIEKLYLGRNVSYRSSPFRYKPLTSLTIGDCVTEIGSYAFSYCSGLTSLTIPNSVTSIGESAFFGCSGLTGTLTIPNSVTEIGSYAFSGCSGLRELILSDGTETLWMSTSSLSTLFEDCPIEKLYLGRNVSYDSSPFRYKTSLTSLTIGESVTSIGERAFNGCSGLTGTLTIPNSVTDIGDYAFYGCSGLTGTLTIGDCVTSIGSSAFSACSGLTGTLTIPNSVTDIGSSAFEGCSGLTELILSDGTETLWTSTSSSSTPFTGCPIEKLYLGRNVSYSSSYSPFRDRPLTSLTIGESVTSIGESAFKGCSGYKIVSYAETPPTLQESLNVASIEVPFQTAVQYAQSDYWKEIDCIYSVKDNLKHYPILVSQEGDGIVTVNGMSGNCSMEVAENSTIEIKPATGKTVERGYLILCGGKDAADEIYNNGLYTFTPSAYHNRNIIKTVACPMTEVTVSQSGTLLDGIGIENIDNIHYLKVSGDMNGTDILAIRKMTNLRLLDMEDANIVNGGISYYENYTTSKNEIGSYFFKDKTNLVKIILPKTVTTIKERAFSGMSNLMSVYISHSVVSIGSEAFESCGLTSVTIPENVMSVGSDAFYGCRSLRELILSDGTKTLSMSTSSSSTPFKGCLIEKLYLGRNVSYSSSYSPFRDRPSLTSVTIGESVKEIRNSAFRNCRGLTSVTIPNSVTSIASDAFYGCSGLTSVTIPNSVTSIGSYAFSNCSGLTSVTIPNSVTSIASSAFSNCSGLTSVTIPNSVTSIGSSAFSGCSGLTSVTIPNSVTSIASSAFSGCSGLTSVTIPNSVTSIGSSAFYGCSGLPSVTIPNSVTSIDYNAFSGCSGLTSVTIPNSVTFIGSYAFSNCRGLPSVTIPNSVTSIDYNAFSGCSGLTSVTIPNSVTSIGESAFSGCSGLTSVTIPNSVTSIGSEAFKGCSGLASVTSLNTTPPVIQPSTFDEATEKSATLHVPEGCKTIYWLHPYWENFTKVMDDGLITDIHAARTDTEDRDGNITIYDLNGTKVNVKNGDLKSLPRGIYVVNGKKTIVK